MISAETMAILDKRAKHAASERARYWRIRMWAIETLGGKCPYCGTTENLEIHHKDPLLCSGSSGGRRGNRIMKDWLTLIPQGKMALCCDKCHAEYEHGGNTNALKTGVPA